MPGHAGARRQGPDTPELNPDRAEVGEPAERKAGDHERPFDQVIAQLAQLLERNQLVEHRAGSQQAPHGAAVSPRHAQQVGDGRKDPAEDRLQRRAELAQAEVHQRDQAQEGDQHRRDVEGQVQAVAGSSGRRVKDVGVGAIVGRSHLTERLWGSRLRQQHLGEKDGAGRRHDHSREDVPGLDAIGEIGRHDPAREVCHARGHHRQQLRVGQSRQIGPDREGRLGLAQEERGGHVQRLGPARSHQPGHDPGKHADDPLHHAQVIEHREQRRDEDHSGQDAKREDEPGRAVAVHQPFAEDELRPGQRAVEHCLDRVTSPAEQPHTGRNSQDQQGEAPLQHKAPEDDPQRDGPRVLGQEERNTQDRRHPDQPPGSIDKVRQVHRLRKREPGGPGPERDLVLAADFHGLQPRRGMRLVELAPGTHRGFRLRSVRARVCRVFLLSSANHRFAACHAGQAQGRDQDEEDRAHRHCLSVNFFAAEPPAFRPPHIVCGPREEPRPGMLK